MNEDLDWIRVAESHYTQCDIFDDELTGETGQMFANAIADIIEENTGERPNNRFVYKISVIW